MDNTTHYEFTCEEQQKVRNSTGHFVSTSRCDNGSFHAILTTDKSKVTCPKCLKLITPLNPNQKLFTNRIYTRPNFDKCCSAQPKFIYFGNEEEKEHFFKYFRGGLSNIYHTIPRLQKASNDNDYYTMVM